MDAENPGGSSPQEEAPVSGLPALPHVHSAAGELANGQRGRVITKPDAPCKNEGFDNENSDLIIHENDLFISHTGKRYKVKDLLGQGTFGQVCRCVCEETGETVAVKVIKNQPAYYHQARVEIGVLQLLNTRYDPRDERHIVRLQDYFVHKRHLCLVFELLSLSLYDLIRTNQFRGLSLNLIRVVIRQVLDALVVLRDAKIIHCDLKPENILLKGLETGEVKVIDFGSACFENRTVYSYIQSRFYRSPEVVLRFPYTSAIDMWSLGCVAAELFLGLPLFPGASEHDLLTRIVEMLGTPPEAILAKAKHSSKFFRTETVQPESRGPGEPSTCGQGLPFPMAGFPLEPAASSVRYSLYSQQEFEALNKVKAPQGKRYFKHSQLQDIIHAYPYRSNMSPEEAAQERTQRDAFVDLLRGVLHLDPLQRWSPRQAAQHPFITGRQWTGPFSPPPDPRPIHRETEGAASHVAQLGGPAAAVFAPMSWPGPGATFTMGAGLGGIGQQQTQPPGQQPTPGMPVPGQAQAQAIPILQRHQQEQQQLFAQQQQQQQQVLMALQQQAHAQAHAQAQAQAQAQFYGRMGAGLPVGSYQPSSTFQLPSPISAAYAASTAAAFMGAEAMPGLSGQMVQFTPPSSHPLASLMSPAASAYGVSFSMGPPVMPGSLGGSYGMRGNALLSQQQASAQFQAAQQQQQVNGEPSQKVIGFAVGSQGNQHGPGPSRFGGMPSSGSGQDLHAYALQAQQQGAYFAGGPPHYAPPGLHPHGPPHYGHHPHIANSKRWGSTSSGMSSQGTIPEDEVQLDEEMLFDSETPEKKTF